MDGYSGEIPHQGIKYQLQPLANAFRWQTLGTKRRKIDEQNYISITEIWGRPAKTTSTKNKAEHQLEKPEANKKRKTKHEAQQENPTFDHPQDNKLELDPPEHKMEQENLEKPVV